MSISKEEAKKILENNGYTDFEGSLGKGNVGEVFKCKNSEGKPVAVKFLTTTDTESKEWEITGTKAVQKIKPLDVSKYNMFKFSDSLVKRSKKYHNHLVAPKLIEMKYDVKTEDKNGKEITKVVEIQAVEYPLMDGDVSSLEKLNLEEYRKIAKAILKALNIMIKEGGVAHFDIKPENILFLKMINKVRKYKLGDFGLATYIDDKFFGSEDTDPKRRGTPEYCAPEIINFDKKLPENYGEKADTFSLGATLYFLYLKDKGEINNASQLKDKIDTLNSTDITQLKLGNEKEINFLDFVKKCVCSSNRLKVEQALRHPFITKKQ